MKSSAPRKKKAKVQSVLSAETIEQFKDFLLKEQQKIAQRIRKSHQNLQANRAAGEESADIGSDDFIRETGFSILGADAEKLRMIDMALRNIENGTYGICQACGKPISEARLWAKPYAKYCIDCKSAREENGGVGPGDFT